MEWHCSIYMNKNVLFGDILLSSKLKMAQASLKGFFKPAAAVVESKTKQQVSILSFVKPVNVSIEDDDVICTGVVRSNKRPAEKKPVGRPRIIRSEKDLDLEEFHDYHEMVQAEKWYENTAYKYYLQEATPTVTRKRFSVDKKLAIREHFKKWGNSR